MFTLNTMEGFDALSNCIQNTTKLRTDSL